MNPATWRTIFLVAVGVVVLWLGYLARAVVTPLLVALVLAYILDPVVRVMERRGLSRAVASGSLVILSLAGIVTIAAVAATQFAQEAGAFYADVVGDPFAEADRPEELAKYVGPGEWDEARIQRATWRGRNVVWLDRNGDGNFEPGYAQLAVEKFQEATRGSVWERPLARSAQALGRFGPELAKSASAFLSGLVEGGRTLSTEFLWIVSMTILFPIYLYYSLVNLSRVYDVGVSHLPVGQRPRIVEILRQIHVTISAFFRGRLITMFAKGALLLTLFAAFGVPFSYLCAAFGAIASLVPVVGGIAAALPPIVLAVPEAGGTELLGLAIGIVVIEVFEGYVMIPALVGRRVGLHPLTVLFCTLVAGDLLGFFGMIVAVPLTAVLKILAAEFVLPEVRRRAGLPPRPADGVPADRPPGASP
jgi:predicted PurR-regulated permease PerM